LFAGEDTAMDIKATLQSQYLAALAMLKQAIVKCPPEAWDDPQHKDRFWFIAYHTLYYAHLYLKAVDQGYVRWEKRRHARQDQPFSKEQVLERLAAVQGEAAEHLSGMDLAAKAGYAWLPTSKLELQLYNLRHIQQHTGELYERLAARQVKLGWVSRRAREKE